MKNKLLVYKGGGYDGCFWEWNVCFWDDTGKWHDVFSSGSGALDTEGIAEEYAKDAEYLLDLFKPDDLIEFDKEWNEGFVMSVVHKINEHYQEHGYTKDKGIVYDDVMFWTCSDCGNEFHSMDDGQPEGYESGGGLTVKATEKLCNDCLSNANCMECGEYSKGDEDQDRYGICSYCVEGALEGTKEGEQVFSLKDVIVLGQKQLARFIELVPAKANALRKVHIKNVASIEEEIHILIQAVV